MAHATDTVEAGRQAQFDEMMERLKSIAGRYKGVRGELLAKVREELEALDPSREEIELPNAPMVKVMPALSSSPAPKLAAPKAATVTNPGAPQVLPSCRACGRTMKAVGDGTLVCQNGHTRLLAG
ncbi:MAG: hypothetical protein U0228_29885 [Myxococcaceae bacterium]